MSVDIPEDVSDAPDLETLSPKKNYPTNAEDGNIDENEEEKLPPAQEGKSEEIFEVEYVMDHMCSPDGFFLKVRWLGYGPNEDSWEPEADLLQCASEVVAEYMAGLSESVLEFIEDFKSGKHAKPTPKGKKKSSVKPKKASSAKAKKEKPTRAEVKKSAKRPQYAESDQESVESDASFEEPSPSSSKKRKTSVETPSNSKRRFERGSVTTKAALKAYSKPVPPNNAVTAALKHRSTWLADDDSDESDDDGNEATFDDELKKKISGTKKKRSQSKEPAPENTTAPQITFKNAPTTPLPAVNIQKEMVPSSSGESASDSIWRIEGLCEHVVDNVKKKLVLVQNKDTSEKKVCSPEDAFKLAGWNLTQWLLDRCEF